MSGNIKDIIRAVTGKVTQRERKKGPPWQPFIK
jgi:hypothetical protein